MWQGQLAEGMSVFDQSAAIGGSDEAVAIEVLRYRPYVECLSFRSACLSFFGDPGQGLEFIERFPQLRRIAGIGADLSSAASDQIWSCMVLGDAPLARRCADEALQIAERCGGERGVVYALLACGNASALAHQWEVGNAFLKRAQQRIAATGAGAEWSVLVDAFQALCLAGMGERERSLDLVRRSSRGTATAPRAFVGFVRAHALRLINGAEDELEAEIAGTLAILERLELTGVMPLLLLERAGLARLRGDSDSMARDLTEARRLFAQMGVTGWDDYARSIEA